MKIKPIQSVVRGKEKKKGEVLKNNNKEEDKKEKKSELSPKQEYFCQLYTGKETEIFGNGTMAYAEAYDIELITKGGYNTCKVNASKLLTKTNIINRINELLETGGFNDQNVEKQHLFLLNQHDEKNVKMKAIDIYYKIKRKYAGDKLQDSIEEEMQKEIEERRKLKKEKYESKV